MNTQRLCFWFVTFAAVVASAAASACILVYFFGADGEAPRQAAWMWRAAALWLACVALSVSSLRFGRRHA